MAQELRPYGAPAYWLNATPDDRLPIRERQLVFLEGITGPRVPSPKRQGLTPRLSFALESRDKSSGVGGTDTIASLTPGFGYYKVWPRMVVSGDLTWESAQHFDQEQFSDVFANVSADAQLSYSLDERNRLAGFIGYARLRDTGDAIISGFLPPNTIVSVRNTTLTWSHTLDQRRYFDFGVSNVHSTTDRPGLPDITTNSFSVLYASALNGRDLLEGVLFYDNIAFEGSGTDDVVTAFARYTRDFGERLSVRGELGIITTSADGGREYPKIGAALVQTGRNARYALEAGREIIAVPGIDGPLLSDLIRGTAHVRFAPAWQVQAVVEQQYLTGLGPTQLDSTVSSFDVGLSYATNRNTWLWARAKASRESSAGQTQTDRRFYFGVSHSFN